MKTSVFFDVLLQHEQKKLNWHWLFSCFLRWNYVQFSRLLVNIVLQSELVFLWDQFFGSGKRHKFAKSEKTAFINPSFFMFKIRISLDTLCCEIFVRFHRKKLKKITNKAIKTANREDVYLGIYNSRIKSKLLTEMIVKHYLIITYCIW